MINGYDINDLNPKDLRRNVSILPQNPFIFTGTIRENLDPFNKANDEVT